MSSARAAAVCAIHLVGCAAAIRPEAPPPVARSARFDEELPLVVTLASDKAQYVVGETITFTVTVKNASTAAVGFFDDREWARPHLWPARDRDDELITGEGPWEFIILPDGSLEPLFSDILGGPDLTLRDTAENQFLTLMPAGARLAQSTMDAARPGRWTARAGLVSKQNYHVRDHCPVARFGFAASPGYFEKVDAFRKHMAEMVAAGWTWNEERNWLEKVEPGVLLGEARSNEIEITVREAE